MKTNPPEAAPDRKTAFYAEGLRLLEIVGPEGHAAILDELEKLEEIGPLAEVPAGLCPAHEDAPEPCAPAELDEPPLVGGPLGHDVCSAGRWLPPVAYSSAVWEDLLRGGGRLVSQGDAAARVVADGPSQNHRAPPRRALNAFDALARHDELAADPSDGAGIQLALEWEWERTEHGLPEGIAREVLAALIAGGANDTRPLKGAEGEREEAA